MLIAPGAGTNTETGSAHRSAFDDLAAAELPLSDSELAAVQRWQGGIPTDAVKRDFSAAYGELAKAVYASVRNGASDDIVEVSAKFKAKDGHTYDARYDLETFIKKGMTPRVHFVYCRKVE